MNKRLILTALLLMGTLLSAKDATKGKTGTTLWYLCISASKGNMTGVLYALNDHVPVNQRDSNGWTPLLYAIGNGQEEITLVLLQHGADPNTATPDGRTPLFFAVARKQVKAVQALLDRNVNASQKFPDGWTPLLYAAQTPTETDMIEVLLAHHADPNATTPEGWTALDIALKNAWDPDNAPPLKAVQLLLAYRADPRKSGRPGFAPVVWAAGTGRSSKEILAQMIASGADPNAVDNEGEPILKSVMYDSAPDLALLLLRSGANWKRTSANGIPIMSSACSEGVERIKLMAAHGVDFAWRSPAGKTVANDSSCWSGDILSELVNLGVSLDGLELIRQSPLYEAAAHGSTDDTLSLLQAGAEIPSPQSLALKHTTPDSLLLFAATLNNDHDKAEIYQLLISYGVDVLSKNEDGKTALEVLDASFADRKSDAGYLQARGVLDAAVQARMLTRGFLADATDRINQAQAESRPEVLKSVFLEGLEFYGKDPGSIELRLLLAEVAAKMTPAPPPFAAAQEHEKAAKALYEKAHTRSEMLGVAAEYEYASALAPWVDAYYKDLCTVYELSGSYGRAQRSCSMYLRTGPSDADEVAKQFESFQTRLLKANQ
jgi:ankyrin repeat protein